MISRLLVANRAEIASRVFRTCRNLGIETVAIHSDADADLPYVAEADFAVQLAGNAPGDTYLRADLVIDAASRAGADAVHPGYGFLSENADFARAVIDAGLTWIGPSPESIEQMGSKIEAKRLMKATGVPVFDDLSAESATEADLPLLVKASAGGGGRGMRIVRELALLTGEIAQAQLEATAAFGDGTVFVEPYVEHGRHVEVQVVGTPEGVLVLGDRDCSLQRRHQKVVEEAPAPALPEATRVALHEAARAAAATIDYRGAGTVEFLYDADKDAFSFLEMNTRLQVEHPVTEEVHHVDLVELQLGVAEGYPVYAALGQPCEAFGHAIEVRLYAEDTAADYAPQSGRLTRFEIPDQPGVRVDSGFATGTEISTYYDAMLAKVIAHAPTREQAARLLAGVLSRAKIHGVTTNRDQLVRVLTDPDFLAARVSTAFLDEHPHEPQADQLAPIAAAVALAERWRRERTVQRGVPVAFRNVPSQPQRTEFEAGEIVVEWHSTRDGYSVAGHTVVAASADQVTLETDGVRTSYDVAISGQVVDVDSARGHVQLQQVPRFVDPSDAAAPGSLLAPMPGTVITVAAEAGTRVEAGDPVVVLEAMKMQHAVRAPAAGTITEIKVAAGTQVASGEVLAVVEETA